MFTSPESLPLVQQMILAANSRERTFPGEITSRQRKILRILKEMAGFPVTIRLLDPLSTNFCLTGGFSAGG